MLDCGRDDELSMQNKFACMQYGEVIIKFALARRLRSIRVA